MSLLLTLPPEVGRKYRYENHPDEHGIGEGGICEIVEVDDIDGDTTWRAKDLEERGNNWYYWSDGKAKLRPHDSGRYVAKLVEDVHITPELPLSDEFLELREKHEAMMQRLKELGV